MQNDYNLSLFPGTRDIVALLRSGSVTLRESFLVSCSPGEDKICRKLHFKSNCTQQHGSR